jgi:4-azaleucine resistance transporter AzlC
MKRPFFDLAILKKAFKYSVPVLLGYSAIGVAFGLLLSDAGYPWWLALVTSLWIYAGAGQFIAVGLFAAGAGLWEVCLVQLVVNARHMAYGLSMIGRFKNAGPWRPYLIFSLTDETFALLSSLPEAAEGEEERRGLFMFYVSALDQFYWVAGSVAGSLAGSLLPFNMEGISFALTALFVVLLIEQIIRVRKPGIFILSGAMALLAALFLPERVSLLSAMAASLVLAPLTERNKTPAGGGPA